jgi:hypothetical protein
MILYSSPMSHPHGHVMLLRSIGRTGQTWPAYWSGPRPGPPRGHFVWSSTVTLGKHLGGFHPGNKTQVMDFWPETNGFDMFWYVLTKKSGENHHFKQENGKRGDRHQEKMGRSVNTKISTSCGLKWSIPLIRGEFQHGVESPFWRKGLADFYMF